MFTGPRRSGLPVSEPIKSWSEDGQQHFKAPHGCGQRLALPRHARPQMYPPTSHGHYFPKSDGLRQGRPRPPEHLPVLHLQNAPAVTDELSVTALSFGCRNRTLPLLRRCRLPIPGWTFRGLTSSKPDRPLRKICSASRTKMARSASLPPHAHRGLYELTLT